jgi:phosphohistidine phosphatase
MEIYIVRHAIAEDTASKGTGDAARALTEEGRQKMKEAAAGFAKLEFSIDKIFSSPLVRAKQTAEILGKVLDQKVEEMEELSPGYGPDQVCAKLQSSAKKIKSVMVVGHEPNCSLLASYLLEGSSGLEIQFKKGAICRIDGNPARKSGTLIFHLSPQILREL